MKTYPANEKRISEVERGRSCRAIVPLPHGETISAGDTVLFALSHARPGQRPAYVKGAIRSSSASPMSPTSAGSTPPRARPSFN
jgi:hypothetical protein